MESSKPGLDLEKELTCSICTELLFQPLTLLDCLHTYCGACLKDWFSFQAQQAENSPNPPADGANNTLTCPSCRAPVRDTKHNATVATLLDMFVAANPDRKRSDADKEDMSRKYKPGDKVLPRIRIPRRTSSERRADEQERRLLEDVRAMSLREAGVPPPLPPRQRRHREDSSSGDSRTRRSREHSRDRRHSSRRDGSRRPRTEDGRSRGDQLQMDTRPGEHRRHRRSESRRREEATAESRRRQIEHQSSLRSLISSGDLSERDIEKEIEDFARQIQEEGLLDGLDLDNIDLTQNDELSRKITEAYRRRQRERTRSDAARRSHASRRSRNSPDRATTAFEVNQRDRISRRSQPSTTLAERHASGDSTRGEAEEEADVEWGTERDHSPSGHSVRDSGNDAFADRSLDPIAVRRGSCSEDRVWGNQKLEHAVCAYITASGRISDPEGAFLCHETARPFVVGFAQFRSGPSFKSRRAIATSSLAGLGIASPNSPGHQRTRSQLYPEPSITCSRCSKSHIEYELHYNCSICAGGNWNICLDCYRAGKGCLHWLGFGYEAWAKWERSIQGGREDLPKPHMLTANRYLQPKIIPGGAEGRRTLTTDDPVKRLESGNFCARCQSWANECFWRCGSCNMGDWGFCNNCVNQGRSCSHPLLPLTYQPQQSHTPPASPRSPLPPHSAAVLTGPNIHNIGPFKPLTFTTRCDVCRESLRPSDSRYHCFTCTSSIEPNTQPGDYDVCTNCYATLEARGQISIENGHAGWRRCLNGHRMIVVGFRDGPGGQSRHILTDLVGGRNLRMEQNVGDEQPYHTWWWKEGTLKRERLVTRDVAADAPTGDGQARGFPPDGGVGMRANAAWAWLPMAEDELMFPKGAEVREIEDVNGDWFFGVYMGSKGLFPSPYVRRLDDY
ncbi:E3 ubiquitin-protein ligase CHFR [Colletotrichum spinosum]|uniref:E3 ubiquitin-protein ligase CHFR n=1 Tax=Colletotrichum spinosum TaxID=1347390 RepID=A0A4R8PYD9_9PEZI|nr:E3 ubiquitin-protein ligase CHFR [Colletotrichum spinosum]